jgi:hypothetical protein
MNTRRLTRDTGMKALCDILDNFSERGNSDEPAVSECLYKIPKHQRFFVWDDKVQQKLIRTIFNGYPIPFIILVRQADNTFTIEDGQQRITTLKRFYTDKFACDVHGTGRKEDLKKYSDLSIQEKIIFNTYQIGCDAYVGSQITQSQIVDIFMLLNQGKSLTDNEKYYARLDTAIFLYGYTKIIKNPEFHDDILLFMGKIGETKTRIGLSDMIGSFLAIKNGDISFLTNSYYKNGEHIDVPITEYDEAIILIFMRKYFTMLHEIIDPITQRPKKNYGKLSSHLGLAVYSFITYKKLDDCLAWYVKKMQNKKYEPSTFSDLTKGDRRNCQGDSIEKRFIAIKKQYETDEDDSEYEVNSDNSDSDSE